MKKAQVLLMGTVLLGTAVFGNSAYAKDNDRGESGSSFFTSFTSVAVPAAAPEVVAPTSWVLAPLETDDEEPAAAVTTTATATTDTTNIQYGWTFSGPDVNSDKE